MARLADEPIEALRVLHLGGYWRGPNDMVRQMMLGLRAAGASVTEYSTDEHPEALDPSTTPYDRGTSGPVWLRWDVLRPVVDRLSPHLVICNAGGLAFRPEVAQTLRARSCLLGIALSDPDVFAPTTRHIAATFDTFLTNSPAAVDGYRALGVDVGMLPIATNEAFFYPVPPRPELACDVLILGRAHPDRVEPVRALAGEFSTHVYGEGWDEHGIASRGFVFGEDALAALVSARVTPVFFRTGGGHALVKVGLFDFLAAGALVATNRFDEVEPYLEYDREVLGFSSTNELVERVRWSIAEPERAELIRAAGRRRVLRDHTWRAVWPRILRRLQSGARASEASPEAKPASWWRRLARWRREPQA